MLGFLFYSNRCQYCSELRGIMERQDMANLFRQICVDGIDHNELTIKMGITRVPTMVLINQHGQKQQIREGEDAMKYVEEYVMNRRANIMMMTEQTRRLINMNHIKNRMEDGLNSHSQMEREGVSDQYAYATEKEDWGQPKSFLPVGDDAKYEIIALQSDSDKITINKAEQEKRMANIAKLRKQEECNLRDIMEREQITKIINATT